MRQKILLGTQSGGQILRINFRKTWANPGMIYVISGDRSLLYRLKIEILCSLTNVHVDIFR